MSMADRPQEIAQILNDRMDFQHPLTGYATFRDQRLLERSNEGRSFDRLFPLAIPAGSCLAEQTLYALARLRGDQKYVHSITDYRDRRRIPDH